MKGHAGVRVTGHSLYLRYDGGEFPARCRCGAASPQPLPTRAKRKEWHRHHLEKVIANSPQGLGKASEVAAEAEITVRQLDHWTTQGYLLAHQSKNAQGKMGATRRWPEAERRVAILMGRLTRAGLTVEASASVARTYVEKPNYEDLYSIGTGLEIKITDFVS